MTAGGRATEAGMDAQAAVATWFAVHILVQIPLGGRFGLNNHALPLTIRLETGEGLDDIDVSQADGGMLHIQSKTNASLSRDAGSPLGKTIVQLVHWVSDAKAQGRLPDHNRTAALLAVRAGAPRTLDTLETGCRAFDLGGTWSVTCAQRNQAERAALEAFGSVAIPAWTARRGIAPTEEDLVDLARLFHVARFTMEEGGSDWREASRLLGGRLYGNEAAGDAPLRELKAMMRNLINNGAPAGRAGLLGELRRLGHQDLGAAGFDTDIARLRSVTDCELGRLAVHTRLPLGQGIPIARESDTPLVEAIRGGSLVVVGEPGTGKTGSLVRAAAAIAAAGDTIVFLSVDRYPGVAIAADLASELGLTHPLAETLAAMPGAGRKILIIDALDAARGGPAEAVFAGLIENVRERLASDWTVVASIRTFDLKNGHRFRLAFAGAPANAQFAEDGLQPVRHFLVPHLTETDLTTACSASAQLGALLASAQPRLAELLRNLFNLSLAAQLLDDGTDPVAFGAIRTQSGLIDVYEDARLDSTQLQEAAGAAAATMARRRRLMVPKVTIGHASLDAVIRKGVLAASGDLVSFAHHVLFDHVAGRFHLDWYDPTALITQLAGDTSAALLLAPALRFAVERCWRFDDENRTSSWQLIAGIFSASAVDPVLATVALRTVVENIEDERDIAGLMRRVAASPADPALRPMAGQLARFATMDIEAARPASVARSVAWARLADALLATRQNEFVDPARVLLLTLFEHSDLSDATLLDVYGRAARALLDFAWSATPPLTILSGSAIRFVGKSFASDPQASRTLLDRVLRDPHFSQYADREAPSLAELIVPITRAAPDFTVQIYAALYSQNIDDDSKSWLGGQPSRILPLSFNRRQDFEHCRWHLGTAMGDVLGTSPVHGTRALIDALIGFAASEQERYGCKREPYHVRVGPGTIELRDYDAEIDGWNDEEEDGRDNDGDLLTQYVGFLCKCDTASFKASVTEASRNYASAAVWSRIFSVAAGRSAEFADLLWPALEQPDFFEVSRTLRAAARLVAAAWPSRSHETRVRFATMLVEVARAGDENERRRWRYRLGRILAQITANAPELEETRALRRILDDEGLLSEPNPDARYTREFGDDHDLPRRQLRRKGVDTDASPIREVLNVSNALFAHVGRTTTDSPPTALAALWRDAMALLALIDANPSLDIQVERPALGHVANAVERVASSPNYAPGTDGLPALATMMEILDRLSSSRFPAPREANA